MTPNDRVSPASKWIRAMRALLLDTPRGWDLYAMESTLFAAGPETQAVIRAHGNEITAANRDTPLTSLPDFVPLGRITDSGAW